MPAKRQPGPNVRDWGASRRLRRLQARILKAIQDSALHLVTQVKKNAHFVFGNYPLSGKRAYNEPPLPVHPATLIFMSNNHALLIDCVNFSIFVNSDFRCGHWQFGFNDLAIWPTHPNA